MSDSDNVRIERQELTDFCQNIFEKLNLSPEDATTSAKVLVSADARGIPSHGVARLARYVNGLKSGVVIPNASMEVLMETSSSLVIHAHGAMGAPVSAKTMLAIIDKARTNGSAFGCVRDSNHFGIAGYYAMMAMPQDMIGIAMTNTAALGVPTFGRQVMFGTNPLAFAAPADKEIGFVLDMATTVVTRGKIEIYERQSKDLPQGWAVDKNGQPASDAHLMLDDMFHRHGGGITPLGGIGEMLGGHKGYGLAIMVDILCALLCGAPWGPALADTETSSGRVSHFFGAMRISAFRDPKEFRSDMDRMLQDLRNAPLAQGEERIYTAGLREFEMENESSRLGIPLLRQTYNQLSAIGKYYGTKVTHQGLEP